jgi:hypothetical protein
MRLEVIAAANMLLWDDDNTGMYSLWGDPYLISNTPQATSDTAAATITPPQLLTPSNKGDPIANFYVSPQGNDANPGTISAPFATLTHARDVVRTINKDMKGPINVFLRGGLYEIPDTIVFDENDSGNNGFSINYQAYPGETPIISGGKEVKGAWQPVTGEPYYKLQLADDIQPFRNLYVNNQREPRAYTETAVTGTGWWQGDWSKKDGIIINKSSLPASFARPQDLEAHWILEWVDARAPVETVKEYSKSADVIEMKEPYFLWQVSYENPQDDNNYWRPRWDAPFILENALEFLDQPGEWYYNKDTHELFYYPKSDENPQDLTVTIPQIETLVQIKGTSFAKIAHDLNFSGITFGYTSWMRASMYGTSMAMDQPSDGLNGELESNSPSAMELRNANKVNVSNDQFLHIGSTAIGMVNNDTNIKISGNLIQDISKNGITMGFITEVLNDDELSRMDPTENQNISVTDNLINQTGIEYWGSPAIEYNFGTDIQIDHNYIKDVVSAGIQITGYIQGCIPNCPTTSIVNVTNNRVDNIMFTGNWPNPLVRMMGGNGIYTNDSEPKVTIANNYVKNDTLYIQSACYALDMTPSGVDLLNNVCDSASTWLNVNEQETNVLVDNTYTNTSLITDVSANYAGYVPYSVPHNNLIIKFPVQVNGSKWPDAAQKIINEAGLESDYQYLLQYLPADTSSN